MIPDRYWSWCTATIKMNIELENESQTTCPIKQCIHIISEVLIIDEKKKKTEEGTRFLCIDILYKGFSVYFTYCLDHHTFD